MRKKVIGSVSVLLIAVMAFVGCGKNEPVYIDDGGKTIDKECTVVEGSYIVKQGKTDYVIVTENNPDADITTAASELQTFFEEATGINLIFKQDKDTTGKEKNMISLGNTSYARLALGETGSELGISDYRVTTKDGDIFVLGGGGAGVLYGVYRLLDYMFGYEFYKEGIYTIAHDIYNLNYFNVDTTFQATIPFRADYSGMNLYGSTISSSRLGLMTDDEISVGERHNTLTLLNPDVYAEEHPDWYSPSSDQLCYTAHGNESELNAMVNAASDLLASELMQEGAESKTFARFQMMDNKNWCSCSACEAAALEYGAVSGAMLKTCNLLGKTITEKLAAAGDDRTIKVVPLLYLASENVPVSYNQATGGYERSESLGELEYVNPLWACMTMKNHAKAWSDDENKAALDMLDKMNCAFDEFWIWDYGVNFNNYLIPFDTFNSMAEDFRTLSKYNISLYLYQLANSARNVTGFNSLKVYLLSELMADPYQDIDELTEKYFDNVYGNGGGAMKQLYDEYRLLAVYNSGDHGEVSAWNQGIYSQTMLKEEYWPRGILRHWLDLLDEALAASGNDGTLESSAVPQANTAAMYERNIMTDGVFVRYIYAVLYMQDNYEENISFKLKLYNDVDKLGFSHVREQADANANLWPLREALGIGNYL